MNVSFTKWISWFIQSALVVWHPISKDFCHGFYGSVEFPRLLLSNRRYLRIARLSRNSKTYPVTMFWSLMLIASRYSSESICGHLSFFNFLLFFGPHSTASSTSESSKIWKIFLIKIPQWYSLMVYVLLSESFLKFFSEVSEFICQSCVNRGNCDIRQPIIHLYMSKQIFHYFIESTSHTKL